MNSSKFPVTVGQASVIWARLFLLIFVSMLLKDSVGALILKYTTPLDPNFIFSVILEKSFKNDVSIKNTSESRKQDTEVWLHYCELQVKPLSHQADFSTLIKTR